MDSDVGLIFESIRFAARKTPIQHRNPYNWTEKHKQKDRIRNIFNLIIRPVKADSFA